MRIKMAASAAVVMMLVAGCGGSQTPPAATPAPSSTGNYQDLNGNGSWDLGEPQTSVPPSPSSSSPSPSSSSATLAHEALIDLVRDDKIGYSGEAAARFVTTWWNSLDKGTQMFVCSHWRGTNFDRIIRDYVTPEWNDTSGGSVWDFPSVRLEMMTRFNSECRAGG